MSVPEFSDAPEGEYKRVDYFSADGARRLAKKIESAWRQAGHPEVRCTIELIDEKKPSLGYAVRSNLINGMPPSAQQLAAAE